MRAFIGIFLPKEIQYDFKSLKQQLRKQKRNLDFVPAPDVHLTIKYLGPAVEDSTVDELQNIIPNILRRHRPFDLTLGKIVLGFPHDRYPKILNISVEPSRRLENLVGDVENALAGGRFGDIYPTKRDYIPHITIARLHGNIHQKKIGEVEDALDRAIWEGEGKDIPVNSIRLIHSEKGKDGYIYRELGEFDLTGK